MGLAGRKVKQRISADPRNLTWADDASKFGQSYLSKFGWDASKGLGVDGEGRTSNIKVAQKLDLLGIGAAQQKDPNGLAWKQNKDFERLLQRLNEGKVDVEPEAEVAETSSEKPEKKRKHKDGDDEEKAAKKKRKKEKAVKEEEPVALVEETVPEKVVARVAPRHRAHRARAIAAKSISSKSAAHISEILGETPTASSSATPTTTPYTPGTLTPIDDSLVTTSTKSVSDYFKERLAAKSSKSSSCSTPKPDEQNDDTPRGGLGSSRLQQSFTPGSASTDMSSMSKFSSLLSSTFLAGLPLSSVDQLIEEGASEKEPENEDVDDEKIKKKRRKDEDPADKEERRRRRREKKALKSQS